MPLRDLVQTADGERHPLLWPFLISLTGHLLFFALILFQPGWWKSESTYFPSVINVNMVDMPAGGGAASKPKAEPAARQQAAPAPPAPPPVEKAPEPQTKPAEISTQETPAVKPEVSVAESTPKVKTSLKYKTFKAQKVLQQALERMENKVESSKETQLQDSLKRLREEVAKTEKNAAAAGTATGGGEEPAAGPPGESGSGGGRMGDLEQIYQTEVAFEIQKNWAYSEQMAGLGNNLVAAIIFKIMPDGTIKEISFTERSGNAYLDDSGYKAIVKSSPVRPFPPGLGKPYIVMGIKFGPEGVK